MKLGHQRTQFVQAPGDLIEDRARKFLGHSLWQPRSRKAHSANHLAGVRFQLTVKQFQQRRFALAVASHQPHPLALFDSHVGTIEQRRAEKLQGDVT